MTLSALINNSTLTSSTVAAADASGDTVSCVFDFDKKLFWFTSQSMRAQYGTNAWNNSSTADPATGVGGISMSTLTAGSYFPAFSDQESSSSCTINAGSSTFVISPPSGSTPWGGSSSTSLALPGQVTGLTVGTMTESNAPLTWNAPASGGAVAFYQVQYAKSGSSNWFNGPLVTSTKCTVNELIASQTYSFQVIASNATGTGTPSATATGKTNSSTTTKITYRGLNIEGSDLTAIANLPSVFPNANAVIIPVFCSTASQTSTDVVLTVTTATITAWVQAATKAGFAVFLGIYLNPRDGSPRQTITPGPSLTGVANFMVNLSQVCQQAAQIGQQNNAIGMFCGVELQPWAGSSVDSGPFSAVNVAQWQAIYNACKTIWPSGIISYAALQTSLGLTVQSAWSANWSFWDAIAIDLYPGSNNTYSTTTQFQTFWNSQLDPDANTVTSVGQTPLIQALINYSNSVGRKLIIVQSGIIPADGNQVLPGQATVLPPPYNYSMQSAWWQAMLNELTSNYGNFTGFFVFDGGVNGYSSSYSGIDYWGVQSTASAAIIDKAYSGLTGSASSLLAPTNLQQTAVTTTSISFSWSAVAGSNITYVPQYAIDGTSTFSNLSPTASTSATVSNLNPGTKYDLKVYAVQGSITGPTSSVLVVSTTASSSPAITITALSGVKANTAFTVSGTLSGYSTAPTLTYVDDPSVGTVSNITESATTSSVTIGWSAATGITRQPVPDGSTVTTSVFSFSHSGMASGTHSMDVTDGSIVANITYTVT